MVLVTLTMNKFDDLVKKVRETNPEADLELLQRAHVFSADAHRGQLRHSGEPYLVHPLEVANLLATMKLDSVTVVAGLLHDVVEDTGTSIERVRETFGPEIAHVVEGVTKISSISFASTEERQAENFRKMLLAMVDDIRVILVKLADRLHNMRTLGHLAEDRRISIARETLDIYAPIANRLGMSKVRNELEHLSFMYLEPESYEKLRGEVDRKWRATESTIERLKKNIQSKLKEAKVPVIEIDGRIKRLYSIHQKLKRQSRDLNQIYDLVALRIVTHTIKECYAVLGIIHHTWSPVPGRFKDFIAMPRPNGYRSLHTVVINDRGFPFEVQIRSEEMHRIAEDGIAAHWKYKEGRIGASSDEQHFLWLRHLLESQQDLGDPYDFLRNLKIDLYPEEVYAFTPKGEVKALPQGATAVDFAYKVHTDVGNRCVAARINGRMVPLRSLLKNGDIVEITTSSSHKPNRDWLNFVSTNRARNKIQHFIHAEEKVRSIELGRKFFEKEARRLKANPKKLLKIEHLSQLLDEFSVNRLDDLLSLMGYGKVSAREVVAKLVPKGSLIEKYSSNTLGSAVRRVLGVGEQKIKVRGFDDLMVFRATCCKPIRGEKIVGYITRGKGVSVHSTKCPNVINLFYAQERYIEVEWGKSSTVTAYPVRLSVRVQNQPGVLAAISSKIASVNTNIQDLDAVSHENQRGMINMTVEIKDLKHLERVIKSLRSLKGVLDVERKAS